MQCVGGPLLTFWISLETKYYLYSHGSFLESTHVAVSAYKLMCSFLLPLGGSVVFSYICFPVCLVALPINEIWWKVRPWARQNGLLFEVDSATMQSLIKPFTFWIISPETLSAQTNKNVLTARTIFLPFCLFFAKLFFQDISCIW